MPPTVATPPAARAARPAPAPVPGIVMTNPPAAWLAAGAALLAMALFMVEYHRLWRAKGYSLATLNEGLAIAGTCGIALAFLLGAAGRPRLAALRRPCGVLAVGFLAVHAVISLFWFQKYLWQLSPMASLALGIPAMAGLAALALTSYPFALARLGAPRWKTLQTWGYLFLALGLAHFVVLGKIPAWINWFRTFDKPAPPGTLIPFTLGTIALLARAWRLAAGRSRPPSDN